MIQITLKINGKEKVYRSIGVRMRTCLDAYQLAADYERCGGEFDAEMIARCVAFVLGVFDHAFTADELMDGYEGSPFALFPSLMREVIGYTADRIVDFPTKAATRPTATTTANG